MKRLLFILLLLPVLCSGQIITTVAGGGTTLGDGGPATAAHVYYPAFGAFDFVGNYYYEDGHPSNPRLRKISVLGVISTVVGNGTSGYGGDGGPATAAMIKSTRAFVDSAGNIYLSDYENYRVRKVDIATGIIHTIAGNGTATSTGNGGPATAATLVPIDVCADGSGNIFISDQGPFGGGPGSVRKISAVTGIITQVSVGCVQGMCFDSVGHLYAGGGARIFRIDTGTGIVDTIAGTGSTFFNGDGIMATAANFAVFDMTLDTAGNIYIADHGNERVRVIRSDGRIYTVVGNGAGTFTGDGGPATAATIYNPEGVAFDPCGNLYIAASGNNRIRMVSFNPTCKPESLNTGVIFNSGNISIYPNPTAIEITVAASDMINTLLITNVVGQTVFNQKTNAQQVEIDVSYFPAGVYFVRINRREVRKFVKQ